MAGSGVEIAAVIVIVILEVIFNDSNEKKETQDPARAKIPWFGLHEKYALPLTEPSLVHAWGNAAAT